MNILFAALGLYLLYKLQQFIYQRYWDRGLSVKLSYSRTTAVEGEEATLIEELINDKKLPLPGLSVKFQTSRQLDFLDNENSAVTDLYYRSDIFSFRGREKITRTLPFLCKHRGYYTITQAALACSDLFYRDKYSIITDNFTQLYVYPRYVDIRKLLIPFNQLYGTILANRHFYEDPFEFRSIREYQPFDPMRAVNWKAYAKTGELMVNTYEDTASQEVCIYLNLENHGYANHYDIMEENIRLAATLADMFIAKGIPVSLKTNGCSRASKEAIRINAGTGGNHLTQVLQSLAQISLDVPVAHMSALLHDELAKGALMPYAIIISNYCQTDFTQALTQFYAIQKNLLFIYTYHNDMYDNLRLEDALTKNTLYWEVEHID